MKNSERRDLGMAYIADKDCFDEMAKTRRLVQKLNAMDASDFNALKLATAELLGTCENGIINPPFHCDYGFHIHVGKNFWLFINMCGWLRHPFFVDFRLNQTKKWAIF